MAGHSQFANIKHRKEAQDKKRANKFTKLAREIVVAAKSGLPDPEYNARLRLAISAAKSQSMPKDRIDAAIKKATAADAGENYEEVRYEAYAPGGIALIIETLTDNRNRTVGEVRSTITKNGGNLGEAGSVAFMFDHIGFIKFKSDVAGEEEMFEAAIEAGAENCETNDEFHEITCAAGDFGNVEKFLSEKFGNSEEGFLGWRAQNYIEIDAEAAEKIESLIDKLEDLDDVQRVFANYAN